MTGIVWWDGNSMSTMPVQRAARNILVLYEDNHLLAVFKPSGLLTQGPGRGHNTLLDVTRAWLRNKYDKPGNIYLGLVHRLDRPVAGVLVLTKTSKAAARLSSQFREGTVSKRYLAVVHGTPHPPADTLRQMVRKPPRRRSRISSPDHPQSKPATLTYRTLESQSSFSLVEIRPTTGRSHQIRVQMAHIDCPILGDIKYGSRVRTRNDIALLAQQIRFEHPTRHTEMVFDAPSHPDWPWPPPMSDRRPGVASGDRGIRR